MREEVIGDCRLILGDCLDVLPGVAGIGAVVTDPPYAIPAAHYVGKRAEAAPRKNLGELSIVEQWFKLVVSMLPNDCSAYIFCDGQSYPIFFRACYNKWKHVRPLIWDKMTSFNGYTWRHQHEIIAWCESGKCERIPTGEGDILRCRAVPVDDRCHPAEKPIALLEQIVAKTRGIVCDPFMGSASTGVACVMQKRSFVGIEIDEGYFDIACRRIEAAYKQPRLFAEPAPKPTQDTLL